MKATRLFAMAAALCLSMGAMAQVSGIIVTDGAQKAQRAFIEYLRSENIVPKLDTRDNSVNFNRDNTLYWVTFKGDATVEYTIHRKGLKFDEDPEFSANCARKACNDVNLKSAAKATYTGTQAKDGKPAERRVQFKLVTYAKDPSAFTGGFRAMLASFKDIEDSWRKSYKEALEELKHRKESIVPPTVVPGASPLKATAISFANSDAGNNIISDWDQPLRKSSLQFIKANVEVSSQEKGLFKLGMRIYAPDGRAMTAAKGVEYASTTNIEVKKTGKAVYYEIDKFGSDKADFWKAGEYRVEIYDYEKNALIYQTTFNVL